MGKNWWPVPFKQGCVCSWACLPVGQPVCVNDHTSQCAGLCIRVRDSLSQRRPGSACGCVEVEVSCRSTGRSECVCFRVGVPVLAVSAVLVVSGLGVFLSVPMCQDRCPPSCRLPCCVCVRESPGDAGSLCVSLCHCVSGCVSLSHAGVPESASVCVCVGGVSACVRVGVCACL